MSKRKPKKRINKKIRVFAVLEGKTERTFVDYLIELYNPQDSKVHFPSPEKYGGNANSLIQIALRKCYCYDRCFVWLDQDFDQFPLDNDTLMGLQKAWCLKFKLQQNVKLTELCASNPENRNPMIIVSQPICFEGMLLQVLDKPLPKNAQTFDPKNVEKQKQSLKATFQKIVGDDPIAYYRKTLPKQTLEQYRNKTQALDQLITAIRAHHSNPNI